jgi:hypothetical protein
MKYSGVILLIFMFLGPSAWAHGPFGLGVIIGDPTGISGKDYLNKERAVDGALGWSSGGFHLHGDYLIHKPNVFQIDRYPVNLYYGLGARFISWKDNRPHHEDDKSSFGPRAPVGLNLNFNDPAIEVFVELALVLEVIPSTDADVDFGIGGRFYF